MSFGFQRVACSKCGGPTYAVTKAARTTCTGCLNNARVEAEQRRREREHARATDPATPDFTVESFRTQRRTST